MYLDRITSSFWFLASLAVATGSSAFGQSLTSPVLLDSDAAASDRRAVVFAVRSDLACGVPATTSALPSGRRDERGPGQEDAVTLGLLPWKTQTAPGHVAIGPTSSGGTGGSGGCNSPQKPGWSLVFADEFDSLDIYNAGMNPAGKWYSGGGYDGAQTHGNELQYYTRYWKNFPTSCNPGGINHFVNSGVLKLQARWDPGSYEVWSWPNNVFTVTCNPYNYTSGMLFSKQKFLYGYFEICCKVPNQGKVLWPAFWLWAGGGNEYREIDIFEFGGWNGSNFVANNVGMNLHIAQALDNGFVNSNHWPNDPINSYPGQFVLTSSPNVTDAFHTYGLRWMPNSVKWYVDDQEVYSVVQHVPPLDMHLIANLAIADFWPAPNGSNTPVHPYDFEIEYMRAYRSDSKEFMWNWGNGNGQIDWWILHNDDLYTVGDFAGTGSEQLLAVNVGTKFAHLMRFDSNANAWTTPWGNGGSGSIHWWNLNPGDQFVAGNFDGIGGDELLAVNASTRFAHLMAYDGTTSSWYTPWGNGGSGSIDWWNINPGDQYVAGDFNDDGRDELLAINHATGFAHLMVFTPTGWVTTWTNLGSDSIHWWNLNPGDTFLAGDFDNNGVPNLLAINPATKWSHMMTFVGGGWTTDWGNSGDGNIAWWIMHPGDQYLAADFDGAGNPQLLAVAQNGWSHLMKHENGNWRTTWGNDGAGTIHLWHMNTSDRYFAGTFRGGAAQLLPISRPTQIQPWAHLLDLRFL